ncbi:MAG: hypothetical protein NC340_08690 [Ruminococcus flavefaciens]|nr:hypothetical protein [Ruminococcus flavefaciens]MCM1229842.1 hypothetical protein [Ruminococcus flavefaciens]
METQELTFKNVLSYVAEFSKEPSANSIKKSSSDTSKKESTTISYYGCTDNNARRFFKDMFKEPFKDCFLLTSKTNDDENLIMSGKKNQVFTDNALKGSINRATKYNSPGTYLNNVFIREYLDEFIIHQYFDIKELKATVIALIDDTSRCKQKTGWSIILRNNIRRFDFGFGNDIDNDLKKMLDDIEDNELFLTYLLLISIYPAREYLFYLLNCLDKQYPKYNFLKYTSNNTVIPYTESAPTATEKTESSSPAVQDECADNFDINTDDITRMLVGISNILCENGKKSGRLIPIREAEKEEPIELPTLDYDSSVSDIDETHTVKLQELIAQMSENKDNYSIIGSGGCGKTYSLLNCAGVILDNYNLKNTDITVIPVYIPLNYLLTESKNIEDYIIKLLANALEKDYNEAERCFSKWKAERSPSTYILLLLDGFNEVVSKDRQASIVNNVKELQNTDSPYRFIITSRYNLSQTFANISGSPVNSSFVPYKMNYLDEDVVKYHVESFLASKGKSPEEIECIIDCELLDTKGYVKEMYRQPMALVMFCGIHTNRNFKSYDGLDFYQTINNLGELIHDFIYCIRNAYDFDEIKDFDVFLSYLGYRMNTDGVFTITLATFNQYLEDFLVANPRIKFTADLILSNSFVRDILKFNSDFIEIRFAHQNYRDYFAAYYLKKIILAGNIREINDKIGIDKKIPEEVVKMLAEILGEYKHDENIGIQPVLNKCNENLSASATAFLVKVAVTGRENMLWDFRFKKLDLSRTHLNGVFLYKKTDSGYDKAVFTECMFSDETFRPTGHAGAAQAVLYVENRYIITCAKASFCIFDMQTGFSKTAVLYSQHAIQAVVAVPKTKRFITGDSYGILTLWEYYYTENNDIAIKSLRQYSISDGIYASENTEKQRMKIINDIDLFNGKIVFSLNSGDVFSADYELNNISRIMNLSEKLGHFCKCSRIAVSENDLYVSYGNCIFRNTAECCFLIDDDKNGYIHDICTVKDDDLTAVLVNYRNKIIDNIQSSVVYKLDDYCSDNPVIEELYCAPHMQTSQGFQGFNKFSPAFDSGKSVYLTANINDASEEAGLYLFSFETGYYYNDEGEEEYTALVCTQCAEKRYGNRHIMSIERALYFQYNNRYYVVTTSIDRSVEILDTTGTEYTLIYHISGHTDGITCMDVIDEKTIYTSHYSGEVCRWVWDDRRNSWKCRIIAKTSNAWLWVVKHGIKEITKNDKKIKRKYIISSSYDHNIYITNSVSGTYATLEGCRGRIKSFDFIGENSIITAYDYKQDNKNKYAVHIFRNIDFESGKAEKQFVFESPSLVRCIYSCGDYVYLVMNSNLKGEIYRVGKNITDGNYNYADIFSTPFHIIEKADCALNDKANMRAVDTIQTDKYGTLFACGGNIGSYYYAELWLENGEKYTIDQRPESASTANRRFDENDGISSIKLVNYNNCIYLLLGSYDYNLYTYRVEFDDNGRINLPVCSVRSHRDKILNVQYLAENKVYVSLLSGQVLLYSMDSLASNREACDSQVLFQAVTGMHIIDVNLKEDNKGDITEDFKKTIRYYGII